MSMEHMLSGFGLGGAWPDSILMAATAFGAATLLPFQSELVFAALQVGGHLPLPWLIAIASVANTAGSATNYVIGRWIEHFRDRRWFPFTQAQLDRAGRWYRRWGVWTLLLSWAPFGDAITVVAGLMRTRFLLFLILVATAKTGRYILLAWATAELLPN